MDCVARREEFPALAKLFVDSFGGTEQFAMSVLENFAGEGNVFAARQDGACTALLCAVPVTLCGRKGAYYYGLTTRPDQRGTGVMTTLMDTAGQELARRGAAFAALIPANAPLFDFYAKRGFEKAFSKRVLRRPVRNNLWAQAEFDTVTAKGLQQLRRKYAPNAVELNAAGYTAVLTDLYSLGITSVCTDEGYGLFFKKGTRCALWSSLPRATARPWPFWRPPARRPAPRTRCLNWARARCSFWAKARRGTTE